VQDGGTRYALRGDRALAYRTLNPDAPAGTDLLFMPGVISHVEVLTEEPRLERFLERICAFARVTLMDRAGTGLSDAPDGPLSLEDEVGDLEAVLDAAGAGRAAILAYTTASALAVHAAVARPERVRALVLYAGLHRTLADEGYDWAAEPEERAARIARLIERWGTGSNLDRLAPSMAGDTALRLWLGRLERASNSPGGMRRVSAALAEVDVRALLPQVTVPTLLLHRRTTR
jgi:pimeloyl-ACP methyl ester carboxylesterase